VRLALETTASSLAALRVDQAALDTISRAFEAHRDANPADVDALIHTDEVFHAALVRGADSPLLEQMYAMLVPEVRDFRIACFREGGAESARQSSFGHGLVMQYIRNGDSGGAKQAMASHLLLFTSRLGQTYPPDRSHRTGRQDTRP